MAQRILVEFSDANKSDGIARGRSGRSLCANLALSQLRKVSVIDGKQFSANDRFMLDGFTPLVMGGVVSGSNGVKSGRSGKIMPLCFIAFRCT